MAVSWGGLLAWGEHVRRPVEALGAQPGGGETTPAIGGEKIGNCRLIGLRGSGGEGERDLAEAELEQAVAPPGLAVIVALRRRPTQNLDLAVVETEAAIDGGDLGFEGAFIRQEEPGWATLDDRGRDGRTVDVGERLGGEDDARILLPQRLQPFPELSGEAGVVEGEPALVDDEQSRPTVEPVADAAEEIGKHGGRRARADQPFRLEGLDVPFAEPLDLRVQQPAPRSCYGIGLERLLQSVRLQEHGEAGDCPLRARRRGERSEGGP